MPNVYRLTVGDKTYGLTFERMGSTEYIASIRKRNRVEFYAFGVFQVGEAIPQRPWDREKIIRVIQLAHRAGLDLNSGFVQSLGRCEDPWTPAIPGSHGEQ